MVPVINLHPDDLPPELRDRFIVIPGCGCWVYLGAWTSGNGYSKIGYQGETWMAHRLVFHLLVAPICKVLHLDHRTCKARWCCAPYHVEPVFPVINTRRGRAVLYTPTREECAALA